MRVGSDWGFRVHGLGFFGVRTRGTRGGSGTVDERRRTDGLSARGVRSAPAGDATGGRARTWRRVKLLIRASGVFLSTNFPKSGWRLHRAMTSPKRNPDANDCAAGGGGGSGAIDHRVSAVSGEEGTTRREDERRTTRGATRRRVAVRRRCRREMGRVARECATATRGEARATPTTGRGGKIRFHRRRRSLPKLSLARVGREGIDASARTFSSESSGRRTPTSSWSHLLRSSAIVRSDARAARDRRPRARSLPCDDGRPFHQSAEQSPFSGARSRIR